MDQLTQARCYHEQNRYLAKNKDVPQEQKEDRLDMIRTLCEKEYPIVTEQDIRSCLTKILCYERSKRSKQPETSNVTKETPTVSIRIDIKTILNVTSIVKF